MQIEITKGWDDYALLDSGDGYRLEKFGNYILSRPDPQIIWKRKQPYSIWETADGIYQRTTYDKGNWIKKNNQLPNSWIMHFHDLSFQVKLTPFKHTGVFPEQSQQWHFISETLQQATQNQSDIPHVLNLFAYTGIASLVAAQAGAKVTHVDASRPAIGWARENQEMSNLSDKPIRWILDDAMKFTQREIHRGVRYDAIIMDPPIFGHGPDGKVWKFNEHFPKLLQICRQILTEKPLFILVNAYAISSSAIMLQNVFEDYFSDLKGNITVGELTLQEQHANRLLSTGIFARWTR